MPPKVSHVQGQISLGQQVLVCCNELLSWHQQHHPQFSAQWQPLYGLRDRLQYPAWHLVVLGQVSRGKSALLNALYGEAIFPVGAIHGTTQWPRTVRWQFQEYAVDLTDTPGLDEVAGSEREAMTWGAIATADLVLFVGEDPLTTVEIQARDRLETLAIPYKMIFTKGDLYPVKGDSLVVSSVTGQGIQTLRQMLYEWLQEHAVGDRAQRILQQITQVEQTLGAALAAQQQGTSLWWPWLGGQILGSALLPGGLGDVGLALLGSLGGVRYYCHAYGLPFPLPAFADLRQFLLLWYAAIYVTAWPGLTLGTEGWGVNATIVLQGAVIFWGYRQLRQKLTPYLQQGYQWGRYGPKRLLAQLAQTRAKVTASG